MIGNAFYSMGISLDPDGHGKWWAFLHFQDAGFCQDNTTEGTLTTRYAQDITSAIDVIIADAQRLGIEWRCTHSKPFLYVKDDGDSSEAKALLPNDWRDLLQEQATRVGFITYGD
jgi:hypothetical protein